MKVVLDSNIIISALVFGGKPREIFGLIVKDKILIGVASLFLIEEILGVLSKKFDYSSLELKKVEKLIKKHFKLVTPRKIPKIIKSDIADNQILAIASVGEVDYIISGDNHLLKLKKYQNIPIIPPHRFLSSKLAR